ncbi:MAG: 1-aminocyclopropane-1-carboxylate deaminase/D-cysteine desulfhydrase [Gemmatimonadaceae bacterium]
MSPPANDYPLFDRFPALRTLPRAKLGRFPSPVTRAEMLASGLWFKREDLDAEPLGGNKVRALEMLLGPVQRGDVVVTVGAAGSTHALATAIYARQLGARALCFRWRQEMNDTARRVADRLTAELGSSRIDRTVVASYVRALAARWRGARWIPAGGSTPLGILGQVNAALELTRQVDAGDLPHPDRVVVPLGTGGTAAGLALGFAIAGFDTEVIATRVVPRIVANARHVKGLIARTARLIERLTRTTIARPNARSVRIVHEFYGGAYGRATAAGNDVARRCLEQTGIPIDPTYGAKALAAAVTVAEQRGGKTLFWLSFDGRWMREDPTVERTNSVALG